VLSVDIQEGEGEAKGVRGEKEEVRAVRLQARSQGAVPPEMDLLGQLPIQADVPQLAPVLHVAQRDSTLEVQQFHTVRDSFRR